MVRTGQPRESGCEVYGRGHVAERRGRDRADRDGAARRWEGMGESGVSEARKKVLAPGHCPTATGLPFSYPPWDQALVH